jgi:DNA polymerase-1
MGVSKDPLYLVDGSGYIFRAYYAVQPLSTSKGFPTNALTGFTRMLAKLIKDVGASYIAVAFDTGEKTFRHLRYPEYKANRRECPEDLLPQMPYFRRIVDAFGIKSLEKVGFEADDVIATIARRMASSEQRVVIVSGDKDLTQLVNGDIQVWDAMRDVLYDRAGVYEKFGVFPEQIVDYLALVGDSSDNVPGVKGIGQKTATFLLEHFGDTERLLRNTSEIEELSGLRGAKSIRAKIESGIEALRLSRELVSLDERVSPFDEVTSVEEFAWQSADLNNLSLLFDELEFSSMGNLVHSLCGSSSARLAKEEKTGSAYHVVTSETLPGFVERLSRVEAFAFDTETTSLDVKAAELVGMSFSWADGEAYYLPFLCGDTTEVLRLDEVRSLLTPIFSDHSRKKYGVNLKFDLEVLEEQGFVVRGVAFDAMLCSYVLNPDKRAHGLKALARIYLGREMSDFKETISGFEHFGQVPLSAASHYACADADASWSLCQVLEPLLGARDEHRGSLRAVFEDIEMPLVPVLASMERVGFGVDVQVLGALRDEFRQELLEKHKRICSLAGEEFNLNSPKQVSAVLFERLGLPTKGVRKTASGYSTDANVLQMLASEHPIVSEMLDYREVHKLNSTYVEALLEIVNPETGRVHASFNQAVAATGRLSSSSPNLQNIPIRTPRGRRIRRAFVANQGNVLIAADYSQIELRVLAHLSGDKNLQGAFLAGEDIHLKTAQQLFGAQSQTEQERKDLRRIAKTINFGIIYGMSAFRLARELEVSRREAQEFIDYYFACYPGVQRYFDILRGDIEQKGFVSTLFGRRRYAQDLDTEGRDAGYAERSLINAPIQGTAAEIIKLSMIQLNERLAAVSEQAKIVLQVHDELIIECDEACADNIAGVVVEEMQRAVKLEVPLSVSVHVGRHWGQEVS